MKPSPGARPGWLQVAITLESELAEPVADLLSRLAPGGVAVESAQFEDERGEAHPVGPVTVRAFLPSDSTLEDRRRRLEEGLWHLGQIRPLPEPTYSLLEEVDWSEAWKAHYQPIPVGRRLLILPAWLPNLPGERLPVILDPGMAFGTGTHPSTQLILTSLEDHLVSGEAVADLGCGSGILSIAAVVLGAGSALAIDIDPEAVALSRQNAARNGVEGRVRVERGSLELLRRPGLAPAGGFPLVLANILASTLTDMLHQGLAETVRSGGRLMLSGILETQAGALQGLCEQRGLRLIETRSQEDWRALVLERTLPPA